MCSQHTQGAEIIKQNTIKTLSHSHDPAFLLNELKLYVSVHTPTSMLSTKHIYLETTAFLEDYR